MREVEQSISPIFLPEIILGGAWSLLLKQKSKRNRDNQWNRKSIDNLLILESY